MNGGVTVVLCIVGALVLCEIVLPRALETLRRWRSKAQAKAKAAAEPAEAAVPSTPQPVPDADALGGGHGDLGTSRPANDAALAFSDSGAARAEQDDNSKAQTPLATSENAQSEQRASDLQSDDAEARRLWDEAQTMTHGFIPDPETDGDYLARVYGAARLGHLEAMVKLGDYAYRRGAIVEAFYWTILAELKGADGLDEALCEMRTQWLAEECPGEYENDYDEFTEEQGDFARAVLCLQCEVDPQYARARLQELADAGNEDARLFAWSERMEG